MYKSLFFLLLVVGINVKLIGNTHNEKLEPNIVWAPCNPIISIGAMPSGPFCAGNSFNIPFSFTDCVDAGNVFTVQLSNAVGLFTSPITIGSLTSVNAGVINVTIPLNTSFGNGYRIRILSSAPSTISADNGFNFTINPSPTANFTINSTPQCLNGNNFMFQNTSTGSVSSSSWSFGDGSASIGTNATKTYNTAGTYNVKLITTGTNGCKDSITKQITVNPKPNVAFTTAASCTNTSIIQSNSSSITSGTLNYFWDFGDGTTSTAALPTKTYLTTGSRQIKLVVTSDNGCKDSLTQNVNIVSKPTAAFTINNSSQCLTGNSFNFTNTSTGSFVNQVWSFGNGVTSNASSITNFTYPTNGVYGVKLLLVGNNGCNDSITQNVTVSPVPNFTINNSSQCLGTNNFIFTNTSIGNLASSSWSFGDGNTASTTNASNLYSTVGTYNVKLKVTEVGGCTDSITKVVTVSEKPNVGFNISTTNFCSGTNLQFNNTSTVGVGTLTHFWSFGDGSTSTQVNPSKSFTTAGVYPVKLVVTNNNGCKDSITQNVTILSKPVAAFNVNSTAQCVNGNQFNFTNNSTGFINSYNWSFGDGNTSSISNPTNIYNAAGSYLVKLFANGNNGCVDSTVQTVTVNPTPNVDFTFTSSCLSSPIGLTNNSSISNGTVIYSWNFGDATTSSNLNPIKSYTVAGNYVIKLVATSNNGCKDSLSKNITILPKPIPNFTINNNSQCLQGNNFVFTNTSTGQVSQLWSFSDGTTSTNLNETKSFATAGVYLVKLVVTGSNGCKDSITQSVTVTDKPVPSFLVNNTTQCLTGNSFAFTDNSSGAISNYNWIFGDGGTSTLQNPTYSFSSIGTYTVKLVVTTATGCKDSITQNVQVVAKPTAAFVINNNNQCIVGNSFSFTNNSTGATSYEWQFGDGGISNTNNAFYTYSLAGTYTVKLIATNATGCKDSTTNVVNVLVKPLASFSVNNTTQCLNGNNFVLNNTSTSIPNGYLWSFSDGTTSTLVNPSKSFTAVGTYSIKLVVTSTNGCKDSITQSVNVLAKPNPNFTINNTTQCAGSNFVFSNTSNASTSYQWSFGEGTTSASTNPSFVYNIGGLYTVKLVATASNGCKDSVTQLVNVLVRPSAIFGVNSLTQCINGNNFVTTNLSSGSISSYNWSFGNGSTSTLTNPSVTYSSTGNYVIKLVATGTNGCKDSLQQNVTVVDKPNVLFNVNNSVQCITNNNFVFTNTTTGATNYSWSFGDGGTSTSINPTKVYTAPGSYAVKLIATGNNGCKDSLTQSISVVSKPIPSFTVNTNSQCVTNNSFVFTNASLGGNVFNWSFGDGTTSTSANPTKIYSTAGTYFVKLIVSNATGCVDSISQSITVHPKPTTDFSLNGGASCLTNPTVSFTNLSTGATSYNWDFGDGTTNTSSNPTKTYSAFGTYSVKLVSTNSFGCKDSVVKSITIGNKPQASFAVNTTTICLGSSFVFTNTSTGSIASQTWDFGDGTTSPTLNPIKAFGSAGTYTVKLIVTGTNGCKDSISQTVTVTNKPTPNFTIVGGGNCTNSTSISLTNTSANAVSYVWSFGDGGTSTSTNPTYSYAAQGTYIIKLVATGANGCKDSISQTVTIATKPIASYTVNTTTQCAAGSPFIFSNTSTGSISSYYWEFGDGIFSTVANPTKVYAVGGTYNVKLVVTGVNGCKDSVTQTVTVTNKPTPNFTIVGGGNCTNSTSISLTNTSTNAVSYVWSFGDGGTSTSTNPTYTYAAQGTYIIKLVPTGANACKDSISQTVTIATKPIASYTVNTTTQCAAGSPFIFSNTSTGSISSYYWEFGDGIFSTVANPTKVYAVGGTYNVKLVVTGVNGCKDSVTQTVTVTNKPTPNFTIVGGGNCTNSTSIALTNTSANAVSYVWSFGDGTNSNLVNPTKNYSAFGTYTIKLIATSNNGCIDSISKNVTLSTKPIPSYTVSSTTVCVGSAVTFNNTSTVNGTGYHYWDFGNGIVSTDSNTSVIYNTAGVYTVKYFLTNAANCKDSLFTTINVVSKPTAFFRILGGGFDCVTNLTLIFDNRSGAANNLWTFSDGTTSTSFSPTKTFPTFGTYTVKVVSWNTLGCADSFSTTFTLTPKPVASFTVNNTTQCTDANRFVFTNNSTVSSDGLPAYYWTFGDGTVSQDVNPVKTYLQAGTYTVTLFVTNANGCKDSTIRTLTVQPKPIASFTYPNNVCSSNNTIAFTNTTTGATSYVWSFGDGTTSTLVSPQKTYTSTGTYVVKLVATNANGCVDSIAQTVTISPKPIASFNVNAVNGNCAGVSVFNMINTSSKLNAPTYFWEFGNGVTDVAANPQITYLTPGVYKVRLTVTNANGCIDTAIQFITVQAKPVASFNTANSICTNTGIVNFANTSTGAVSYIWKFHDGTQSTIANASKFYNSFGTFAVKLLAINSTGCVDSITQNITVAEKPIASFNVSNSGGSCAGTTVFTMSNTSSRLNVPNYFWQFGNGATAAVQNPSVTYANPGIYTIKLTVTNANGCVDTAIQFVNVTAKPTVSFTVNNNSQCLNNNSFVFTPSVSNPSLVNYTWSFGDGTFSNASNPTKSYTAINSYSVKLVASTANGCVDSAIQTVTVNPIVQANFNASVDLCTSAVTFNNLSTGTSTGFPFTWYFGDGTTSQVANPVKQYSTFGNYTVKLVATNRFCSDSISKQIFVPQRVSAQFRVNSVTQCLKGNVFSFNVVNPIAGNTYTWDFGDTTFSTLQNVSKVYTRVGSYTVKLIVRNSNGCVDSTITTVQINGTPTPSFIYTSNYICAGTNIQFINTTNVTTGVSYTWSFGDGTFSNDYSPFKSFVYGGVYTVKLITTSATGCKDSSFVNVLVNEPPKPVIATSIVNRCKNIFNFSNTNAGVAPLTYNWNFGEGTTSTLANPQKTYSLSSGTINVTLTVTDTFGCTATANTLVNLNFIANTAFSINALQQCITNNSFQFTNTTTGVPINTTPFIWDFGDGTTSTSINAVKTYSTAGNYSVKLVTILSNGCRDSLFTTVRVNPIPGARISGISTICNGSVANVGIKFFGTPPFNITYTDGTTNFALNNILTDTITIPVRPTASSAYRIVQMSDGGSCPVSLAQTTGTALVTVIPAPIITRQPVDTGACLGGSTRLYVNVNSSTPVIYQWLKNGIEIVGANSNQLVFSSLQPADVANYNVKVISSTCGEILSNTVNVSIGIAPPPPVVNNRTVCFNATVTPLTATGSNLIWYTTSLGGNGTNIAPIPNTTVKGSQAYFVSSSSNYCESSRVPLTVTVVDSPKVVVSVTPRSSLLPGQTATITATVSPSSYVPTNYFWFKNGVNVALGTNTLTVPFAETGTYYVNAIIPSACNVSSDSIRITQSLALAQAVAQKRIFIVPNPVRDVAAIYFDAPLNETIVVRLVDELGRIRSSQTINYLAAFQKVDLNVRNLVPGYYAIEVLNSKGVSIARDILFKYSR
jgi:PKD repeat protein